MGVIGPILESVLVGDVEVSDGSGGITPKLGGWFEEGAGGGAAGGGGANPRRTGSIAKSGVPVGLNDSNGVSPGVLPPANNDSISISLVSQFPSTTGSGNISKTDIQLSNAALSNSGVGDDDENSGAIVGCGSSLAEDP